jgi:metallo-beta-lactamase class B
MKCKVNGVVATHFNADCVGGIAAFHKNNIPSYASNKTLELLKAKGSTLPRNGFVDSLELNVGDQKVYAQFVGEGHTKDNVIGYFPNDKVMFGGCLIKEVGAGKGNLEDTNVAAWPETVKSVKAKYPQAFLVIPGHGKAGGHELFDYTVKLFEGKANK